MMLSTPYIPITFSWSHFLSLRIRRSSGKDQRRYPLYSPSLTEWAGSCSDTPQRPSWPLCWAWFYPSSSCSSGWCWGCWVCCPCRYRVYWNSLSGASACCLRWQMARDSQWTDIWWFWLYQSPLTSRDRVVCRRMAHPPQWLCECSWQSSPLRELPLHQSKIL